MMRLEPEGCYRHRRGRNAGGKRHRVLLRLEDLAWIGMVLTLPEFRGRGLARRLMEQRD